MFAGFKLELTEDFFNHNRDWDYQISDDCVYHDIKLEINNRLSDFIVDGEFDDAKLQGEWFPQVNYDVFISHSPKDEVLALALSKWLGYHFGLDCFIGSYIWGCANNLLKKINNVYSNREKNAHGYTYDYQKCNTAVSHVHTMLSTASQKMIDKTEAVFILNPPKSIQKYDGIDENSTYSPWIYSEISFTEIIRRKIPSVHRQSLITLNMQRSFSSISNFTVPEAKFQDEVGIENLKPINEEVLTEWTTKWKKERVWRCHYRNDYTVHPLNELYKIIYPKEIGKFLP